MRRQYSFGTILIGKSSLLREGLAGILRSANFRILASVSCADDLLTSKIDPRQVLFLVVHTSNSFGATVEQVGLLKDRYSDGRLAVVADRYRPDELISAFRAGATGYFVDVMSSDAFVKSIELVMMGETVFPVFPPALLSLAFGLDGSHLERAALRDDNQAPLAAADEGIARQLSPREKTILNCLVKGDSNKSIARKIEIAEATVKVHVKAILRKIGVHNRTQAAIWAMNKGSLAPTGSIDSPPLAPCQSKRVPTPMETIPVIKQIDELIQPEATEHEANHVGVPYLDRVIRKGAARLRE
jgi:DNA-binding NarL/FixJ family response regulator